jgi:hypothetical protein
MPKRKEPPLPPKEQFKRFIETAREHEVDESGKEMERAFKSVASGKKRPIKK